MAAMGSEDMVTDGGLRLPELLTVEQVAGLRARLSTALEQGSALTLDGGDVSHTDACGIQLLVAARRAATARGLHFGWRGASGPLCRDTALLGLGPELGLDG